MEMSTLCPLEEVPLSPPLHMFLFVSMSENVVERTYGEVVSKYKRSIVLESGGAPQEVSVNYFDQSHKVTQGSQREEDKMLHKPNPSSSFKLHFAFHSLLIPSFFFL